LQRLAQIGVVGDLQPWAAAPHLRHDVSTCLRDDIAASRLGRAAEKRQLSSVNSDLTEQVPNRLAILRDNRQLIAESIGRLVKRSRIRRASTP
jgi:hypothetical protein